MAEQMKLSFLATTASKIDELPIVNGQFILIKDINTIAVDMNDKRTKYEQIITLASDSDRSSILAPVNGIFYFVVETNSLWKYDQGWKMICSAQSAIPTGGSNGQILKKKSDSDYDVEWQDDTGGSVSVEYDAEKEAIIFKSGGEGNNGSDETPEDSIESLIFKTEDGKKYSLSIKNDGTAISNRIYEVPKDGLLLDVYMKDGSVYNSVSNQNFSEGRQITDTEFGIHNYRISEESYNEFTYVGLIDYQALKSKSGLVLNTSNGFIRFTYGYKPNFNNLIEGEYNWDGAGYDFYNSVAKISRNGISKNGFLYFAISFNSDGTAILFQDEKVTLLTQEANALPFSNPAIGVYDNYEIPYKRICIYNRALTTEELEDLMHIMKPTEYLPLPSTLFKNGLVGLSSPTAFCKTGENVPYYIETDVTIGEKAETISGIERNWENIEYSPIEVTDDMAEVEELLWTHIKDEIEVGDIFACEAYPYPYDIYTSKYNVEYESSDSTILECVKGVLFARTPGKATITAKLSNSELSCSKEIEVVEKVTITENFLYLSENYSSGINSLINDNPRSVAAAIKYAIYEAKNAGYNGIVFPEREYDVRFDDCDKNNVFIQVPSDFIIDFNGSTWKIQERADISTRGVTIFKFGKMKEKEPEAEGTYGDWEMCKNSVVKNLKIYGERYYKEYGRSEVAGDQLADFQPSSRNCSLINIYAEGMTGWITDTHCSDYNYWTGKGDGENRRGRTLYTDYVSGKLDETGTEVVPDPTGVWYCTPEYLKLGYTYGKDSVKSNEMDKYLFGFMGIVTYGNPGRWYDIYFFDEEKQLISYNPKQFGLEPYQLPENAVYFKVNIPLGAAPTKNSGEDSCLIRMYPYMEAEHIVFDNCKFVNPQYTSFSMTGGRDCIIKDSYCEQGLYADWGWAIDWEDGWQTMRHNIHYRTIINGNITFPGSHHNCVLGCFIRNNINVSNDTEDVVFVNNVVNGANIQAKTNNALLYNYYNGTWSLKTVNAGVNRDGNNEKISGFNDYIT